MIVDEWNVASQMTPKEREACIWQHHDLAVSFLQSKADRAKDTG